MYHNIANILLDAIPGLPTTYLSAEGQNLIAQLYKTVASEAKFLFKILLLITFGMTLFAGEKWSLETVIKQAVLAFALYFTLPFIFGATITLGIRFANKIYSPASVVLLTKDVNASATKQRDQPLQPGNDSSDTSQEEAHWYDYMFAAIQTVVPGPGQITAGVMALSAIVFYVVTGAMNILWLLLVAILYIMGPIPAVLTTVPGWGGKIMANWFGAVVQLSALKIWLAICAFFVDKANIIFLKNHSLLSFGLSSTQLKAITVNLIFIGLYGFGPFLIARIFPISNINTGVSEGLIAGIVVAKSTITKTIGAVS